MNKKILIIFFIFSLFIISGCVVSKDKYQKQEVEIKKLQETINKKNNKISELNIKSDIKNDYLNLYQYIIGTSIIEGSLNYQYWEIYNDPDGIYLDMYKEDLNLYKQQISLTIEKIDRLINKISDNPNINLDEIPKEINSLSKLEDIKYNFNYTVNLYQKELEKFN